MVLVVIMHEMYLLILCSVNKSRAYYYISTKIKASKSSQKSIVLIDSQVIGVHI